MLFQSDKYKQTVPIIEPLVFDYFRARHAIQPKDSSLSKMIEPTRGTTEPVVMQDKKRRYIVMPLSKGMLIEDLYNATQGVGQRVYLLGHKGEPMTPELRTAMTTFGHFSAIDNVQRCVMAREYEIGNLFRARYARDERAGKYFMDIFKPFDIIGEDTALLTKERIGTLENMVLDGIATRPQMAARYFFAQAFLPFQMQDALAHRMRDMRPANLALKVNKMQWAGVEAERSGDQFPKVE